MTTHISDNLTWTDKEEKDTAKEVINMINSPKSTLKKFYEGFSEVYEVMMDGEKKATIANIKMDDNCSNTWKIWSGKFEKSTGILFVDDSEFDKKIGGIRKTVDNKIATQEANQKAKEQMAIQQLLMAADRRRGGK